MKIRILPFASATDAMGADEVSLLLDDGATIADLRVLLVERYPALGGLWERLAIAVDGEIANSDQVLADNVEVALLPPVSGGSMAVSSARRTRLTEDEIDTDALIRSVERPECGAVLLFVGTVRNHHQGRPVRCITYTAYTAMAESRLARIESELDSEFSGSSTRIVHRLGQLDVGETSVAIAVSSAHREDAYGANRIALERIKAEVPIWKKEHYADGETAWREEESLLG